MHALELEQPVFGANYIKGKVRAEAGGTWWCQGSETRVDTQKNPADFFLVNPPKKPGKKIHPKFYPVSFLVLLITKDFMFKALEKL